jgi:hypothetical protein
LGDCRRQSAGAMGETLRGPVHVRISAHNVIYVARCVVDTAKTRHAGHPTTVMQSLGN